MSQNKIYNLKKFGYLELDNINLKILSTIKKKINYAFDEAIQLSKKNDLSKKEFNHFIEKVERGSLDIDCTVDSENLSLELVKKLEIIDLAKIYWKCDKIKYSRSYSKFRYVDPLNFSQTKYSPLHYDGAFLKNNRSINICIPFTGYGGDYPGLQIFPLTKNFFMKKIILRTPRFSFLNVFLKSYKPVIKKGNYICFNQNVYHKRTIDNSNKTRINLEFRIFPDYINDKTLDLKII